ncbi:MAG: M61 family metallopeptidase [Acidobacteria bacterium]|nr:M61 family metallopeptidase [Acidobacteriota bacterium]
MRRVLYVALALVVTAATMSDPSAQSLPQPIRYTLRFPAPATHYVEVEAVYPTDRRPEVELMMAVWTPGSYLVREYERQVENLTVSDDGGRALTAVKPAKNRWRIATAGAATVTVRYRVYGREMTVRNNWVEAGFAMLNGAPTFITLAERTARPHEVTIVPPPAWQGSATPLMPLAGRAYSYRAEDFDTLVDSPIIVGNPVVRSFEVDGRAHHLVLEGDPSLFDADRAAADVKKIVEAGRGVMGRFDYPHYFFLNMVTESGGGLEHKNAFLTMSSRFTTRTRRAYVNWLNLVGHEYFHNWNIKRLRPIELGPFDYEGENYTKSLWVGEGFTDYYGALLVRRAGLQTEAEYFDELSNAIEQVQMRPGRNVQPVDMASFDAWIKQYRPDENSVNTSIDYYSKGAAIAFMLDAKIRKATGGAKTLDTAMRLAYERYSGATGYTPEQFQQTMGEAAGVDLGAWFADVVSGTTELDFAEALDFYGLRFTPVDLKTARATMGASTRNDNGRLVVSIVRRGTPAYAAGVNVDDEIVAIDDLRVRADGLVARMDQYKVGDTVRLLVARRDRLLPFDVTLAAEPGRPWRIQPKPDATAEQKARLAAWLGATKG